MPTYNCYTAFERVYVKCTEAAARMDPILWPELTDPAAVVRILGAVIADALSYLQIDTERAFDDSGSLRKNFLEFAESLDGAKTRQL